MVGIDSTLGELFQASPVIFILVVAAVAAGIYFYFKLRRKYAPAAADKPEARPATKPYAQGEVASGADDAAAAALMAIVAEESKIPLGDLKFISITVTGRAGGGSDNGKYVFKLGEESSGRMKYKITYNDAVYEVTVEGGAADVAAPMPATAAVSAAPVVPAPTAAPKTEAAGPGASIEAPLAGVILEVNVNPGE